MLDAWHYFRSDPDRDAPALHPGRVDPRRAAVRCAGDARARSAPRHVARTAAAGRRRTSRLRTLLADLRATGTAAPLGVEVFSDVLHALDPEEVGRMAGASLRSLLARGRPLTQANRSAWVRPIDSGEGDVVEIDAALSGDSTLQTTRLVPAAMSSVTGTVRHAVHADALGTWRTAVPCTRPVSGSSARTVSVDGLPVALATRQSRRRRPGFRNGDGHGHAAAHVLEVGDVAHSLVAAEGVLEAGRARPGADLGLEVRRGPWGTTDRSTDACGPSVAW